MSSVRAEIGPILQTHTHTRVSYSSIDAGPTFRRNRLPDEVRPIDVFELFFDGDVIDLFVEQTNANQHRKKAAQPHQHNTPWTDTTSREMKAFFGIAISMRIVRLPK